MDRNDSPNPSPRKLKFEQLRADYELFLQTFEKPTQIYRYLRTRHMLSPLFLHRTLSYMNLNRDRRILQQNKRKSFQLDSLLESAEEKNSEEIPPNELENHAEGKKFMNLTFSGFFHGPEYGEEIFQTTEQKRQACLKDDFVEVELQLIKVLGKRKKDSASAFDTIDLGTCKTAWNPRTQLLPLSSNFTLSVPVSKLHIHGKNVKTHILSVQVSLPAVKKRASSKGKRRRRGNEELCPIEVNGSDHVDLNSEPPSKKLKREFSQDSTTSESDVVTPNKIYYAQLIIFDRHKNCLLDNGDYELLLHPGNGDENDESKASNRKDWESNHSEKLGPYEMFAFGPTIRFQLQWDDNPIYPTDETVDNSSGLGDKEKKDQINENKRVFYQFIYNNNTRQQTEARDDYYCPWCSVNCLQLYSLLKHLKTCHPRFMFVYTPLSKGARIDVCLNDNYSSGWGNQWKQSEFSAKCVNAPAKKKPFTETVVKRAAKVSGDLIEFTEPDADDIEGVKPFVKGHDRLYYHSSTCQPFGPQEAEDDSEDEVLPEWLREKTKSLIDEFSDVNEGEKELMKLWNLHIMTNGYIADFQIASACRSFVEKFGEEVLMRNLKRNFLVHLINLNDFNLIGPGTLSSTMALLNTIDKGVK